jgi:HEPN domain-containing protein
MDIAREGIALYQSDDTDLPEPKPRTPAEALTLAKEYFEEWLPSGHRKLELAREAMARIYLKDAAFLLHQAAESYYHCVLLVCTFYTPHVHNLGFLRTQGERIDMRLVDAWPRETKRERAMFEKLKAAYIKARYSKHYRINEDELTWLGARVEALGGTVETVCSGRIQALEAGAKPH